MSSESKPITLLQRQLLEWIAHRPRSYAETMEAWRSSCPRLSVWEDSLIDGLVQVIERACNQAVVELTERGRAILETARS
jgi:hypothetical protein